MVHLPFLTIYYVLSFSYLFISFLFLFSILPCLFFLLLSFLSFFLFSLFPFPFLSSTFFLVSYILIPSIFPSFCVHIIISFFFHFYFYKVIKSFVSELRSRKCFSCFEIPMFHVYIYVLCTFRIAISWLCNT